ncbi:MAG: hypothetical protein PHX44_02265 [Sulfurimonas sp.]|uniref:hypothetical protein n=1 Tax=Sulfurimonas sp. TaxID=2022749 RepID=UPI00262539E6|nr:hypothetical protein [Sulfurimonas sp.]MDD2651860.1 hypothetical protein [Sulfurimonas sp.]MDD3451823.1 hypothetical protein [Sulfurimonas sp.]
MREETSLAIIRAVADAQKDLIVIFQEKEPILVNKAFEKFFAVASLEQYKQEFGPFVRNFVPHPSYFHGEKLEKGVNWIDEILELDAAQRLVSMVTPTYEPHAFSVCVQKIEEYAVVTFSDITQTLIKRIMIENNTSVDTKSGAYSKNYFTQIAQSFQDAALFNKKIISAVRIEAKKKDATKLRDDEVLLKTLTHNLKSVTRQDDMLIRWDDNTFVVLYLVDNSANSQIMLEKLQLLSQKKENDQMECLLQHFIQKEDESIKSFSSRIGL